jgi:heptaprenyl diphosphate synthase
MTRSPAEPPRKAGSRTGSPAGSGIGPSAESRTGSSAGSKIGSSAGSKAGPGASLSRGRMVAYAGLLTALALIFSYVEAILPFQVGIPGVKLGIANLVVLITLYLFGARSALLINLLRIFLAGFLFSGVFGILYSLAGGLLSLGLMVLLKKTGLFSLIGISVAGGVMHNVGQLLTAALIIENIRVFVYFPVLLFSGIVCGIIVGTVAWLVLRRLPGNDYSSRASSR